MGVAEPMAAAAEPRVAHVRNPYSALPTWAYPTAVVVVLGLFLVYATWVVFLNTEGRFGPYLSPFYSPEFHVRIAGFLIPPGIWIGGIPLSLRLTCYYYRKAYFRGFLWHPRSCAVSEPHRGMYRGETRFWIFNNLHRYAFYLTAAQVVVLWYDVVVAFWHQGGFAPGLGAGLMLVNVVCLSAYTYGCHSFRHLVGGGSDCLGCNRTRYGLWRGVTALNLNHGFWAWISMFTVWATDLYIRLLVFGAIPAWSWV